MVPLSGRSCARSRQGFTITELLIAATISLILTYAVVQMFDYVASEARFGRASIELASQLRNASRRIGTDLASATAPVRPFADRHGQGYFEYVEGPGSDSWAMVYTEGAPYPTTTPGTYTPTLRTSAIDASLPTVAVDSSLGGDIDDILMFTAYNPDEPFRGRYTPYTYNGSAWVRGATTIIESKYAEIAIWTVRQSNGRVNLYRRAFLIRPDLRTATAPSPWGSTDPTITPPAPNPPRGYYVDPPPANNVQLKRAMQLCYQENDISVRYEFYPGNPSATPAIPDTAALVGNTLADLSRRENRFAHVRSNSPNLYPIDLEELQLHDPSFDRRNAPYVPGWTLTNDTTSNLYFEGNDVLLSEVLAFDVKAYDPLAYIRLDENSFAMSPSDPGYQASAGPGGGAVAPYQTGAFVDLGYDVTLNGPPSPNPVHVSWFSNNPHPKSKLLNPAVFASTATPAPMRWSFRTYCTWSHHYEMNGNNENASVPGYTSYQDAIVDGGSNGVDDDGDGVVDEAERPNWLNVPPAPVNQYMGEGDTSPPYLYPMRGVQVTLRVMEPNSRQVRQMSVVQNFVGE